MLTSLPWLFLAVLAAIPAAKAIIVTLPVAGQVWNGNGTNEISWSVYPQTYPVPTSPYFDIYLRNGLGTLYPTFLNLSLTADSIDATAGTSVAFTLQGQLKEGTGYQLFFSNPDDASDVYCESGIFSISLSGNSSSSTSTTTTTSSGASSTSTYVPGGVTGAYAQVTQPGGLLQQGVPDTLNSAAGKGRGVSMVLGGVVGGAALVMMLR
ncbi:hypothetical protein MNV49_003876 [Pseudohyphozyma bogoriensis]|nr:hypothetical protein MNV49_003876 [Pseudohyphozyma bogoriensis]